ncbi:MAG TPA: cation:proton antiporter [Gaiellaceae bacterium]|nr:cation:proton antiporter [Gaiellaceae bacterium]
MEDLARLGVVILAVAGGLLLAVGARVVAHHTRIPAAALLLVAAAAATDLSDRLAGAVSFVDVQRLTTVALLVILFDGGISMGLSRFRAVAGPVLALGIVGTFATAGLVAVAAHVLLGYPWIVAGLIGAAIAPTDPAVTFSVLAGKNVEPRTRALLEGESGFNDPVGIALMVGLVELATHDGGSFSIVVWEFLRELSIGLGVGVAGGAAMAWLVRRVALPERTLYPLAVLLAAGTVFGAATAASGSGFLAVFVAGILLGDVAYGERRTVLGFHSALATLGELAAFVALGLTVSIGQIVDAGLWWRGLVLALVLGFVARPLVVLPLLAPTRLTRGERAFVVWSGLKGAVPILLASLAVVGGTRDASEIYGIVFVVVLFSVVVQGATVSAAAARLGVAQPAPDEPSS